MDDLDTIRSAVSDHGRDIAVLQVEVRELQAAGVRLQGALDDLRREVREGQESIRTEVRDGLARVTDALQSAHAEALRSYPPDAARAIAASERSLGAMRGAVYYGLLPILVALLGYVAAHLWR